VGNRLSSSSQTVITSATEKFEKSDFWIFSFLLISGPVHTPTAAGGGGGVAGRSLPALDVRPSWTFAAWKWDPILYSGLFFPSGRFLWAQKKRYFKDLAG
jgi:hypothetical protein